MSRLLCPSACVAGWMACFVLTVGVAFGDAPAPVPGVAPPVLGTLPSFLFTDQNGLPHGSARLEGQVWVVSFMCTRCEASWRPARELMQQMGWAAVEAGRRDEIRFVAISVDAEFDRPLVLRAQQARLGPHRDSWVLLTAPFETVIALSADGFLLPLPRDPEIWPPRPSAYVALVDRLGRVRGYYDATRPWAADDLRSDLRSVLDETAVPDPTTLLLAEWSRRRTGALERDVVPDGPDAVPATAVAGPTGAPVIGPIEPHDSGTDRRRDPGRVQVTLDSIGLDAGADDRRPRHAVRPDGIPALDEDETPGSDQD